MWLRNNLMTEAESRPKLALLISLSLALAWQPGTPAAAGDLVVRYDQSQLLRLPRPATEVIIGNPSIADVALQGGNLLVVTGKTFGITNVIALDADRNVIQDQRVLVVREDAKVVNVQKGNKRETYNCSPMCNPSMVVGDDQAYFDQVGRMSERKIKFTEGNSDPGGAQGGNQ